MKKDYYFILGLTAEATAEEIRSAYRRLADMLDPLGIRCPPGRQSCAPGTELLHLLLQFAHAAD